MANLNFGTFRDLMKFRWGWIVCAASFTVHIGIYSLAYSFSLLFVDIQRELNSTAVETGRLCHQVRFSPEVSAEVFFLVLDILFCVHLQLIFRRRGRGLLLYDCSPEGVVDTFWDSQVALPPPPPHSSATQQIGKSNQTGH